MEVKKYINDLLELTNSNSTDNQKIKDLKHTINRYFVLFPTKVRKMTCSGVKTWLDDNLDMSHQIYSGYYTEQQKGLTKLSFDILDTCFILNGRIIPTEPILAGPPSTSKPGDPPPKPRGPPPPPKPGDPPRIGGPPRPPGSEELPRPPLPPGGHPRPALVLPPKSDDPLPSPLPRSLPPSEVAVPTTVALELPEKYAKMKKMGVPQEGIIQKMKTDGMSQENINKYFPPAPVVTSTVDSSFDAFCNSQVYTWKFITDNMKSNKQPTSDEYKEFILKVYREISTKRYLQRFKQADINRCITKFERKGYDPINIPALTEEEIKAIIEEAKKVSVGTTATTGNPSTVIKTSKRGMVLTDEMLTEAMAKRKSSPKLIKIHPINETTCKEIIDWYAVNYKKDDILELIKTYSNDKKIDLKSVESCIKLMLDPIKKYSELNRLQIKFLETKITDWKKSDDIDSGSLPGSP
jgi:hypothetical protein